jgi:hypothetical protein
MFRMGTNHSERNAAMDINIVKVDPGKLPEVGITLIKKISKAIGGIFEPHQIRRIAQANADAALIQAENGIQITDLHRRAFQRFANEEARKQDNMESITEKAIPLLEEDCDPSKMEDDFVANFFDKCRIVSDTEMQMLWAKILAGEANAPGSYSKRTVNTLGSLDEYDAILFTNLCSFCWGDLDIPVILSAVLESDVHVYSEGSIDFRSLTHLDNIGLISFSLTNDLHITSPEKTAFISYFGHIYRLDFIKDNKLPIGMVILTQIGKQLASVCNPVLRVDIEDYIVKHWQSKGIITQRVMPSDLASFDTDLISSELIDSQPFSVTS